MECGYPIRYRSRFCFSREAGALMVTSYPG